MVEFLRRYVENAMGYTWAPGSKSSGFSNMKKCHPDNRIENDMEEWLLMYNEIVGIKLFSIYSIPILQLSL